MIRQTKNYLFGALSGVTLIGIAIAAFVVIVSAQVFHEWPIAETGATASKSSVGPAKAVGSPATGGSQATAAAGANPALGARAGRANARAANSTAPAARAAVTRPRATPLRRPT